MVNVRLHLMALGTSTPGGISRVGGATGDERAALEGMLRGYPLEQLVEEVLVAWQEYLLRSYRKIAHHVCARGRGSYAAQPSG